MASSDDSSLTPEQYLRKLQEDAETRARLSIDAANSPASPGSPETHAIFTRIASSLRQVAESEGVPIAGDSPVGAEESSPDMPPFGEPVFRDAAWYPSWGVFLAMAFGIAVVIFALVILIVLIVDANAAP